MCKCSTNNARISCEPWLDSSQVFQCVSDVLFDLCELHFHEKQREFYVKWFRYFPESFHNPLSVSFNPIRFGSVCVDGHDFLDLRLLSLIQRCCDENPYNRPSVGRCIEVVSNLMDAHMGMTYQERLVRRLASYAESLEVVCREKTTLVIRERDKCERLLQELVPK